jgi:hypothetical protein
MRFMNAVQLREHLDTSSETSSIEALGHDSFVVTTEPAGSVRMFGRPASKSKAAPAVRATFLDWTGGT